MKPCAWERPLSSISSRARRAAAIFMTSHAPGASVMPQNKFPPFIEDVRQVYQKVTAELEIGAPFKNYQKRTCELFEEQGHPTVIQNPLTQEGYVHGLGHGVGLQIHERPFSRLTGDDSNRLEPGAVFTIEPGLYYPERGMGVRIEDTLLMRPDGVAEVLVEYPNDLVLPVKSA